MVEGYNQSAATLNLLRAFTKGGYADLTQVHLWNKDFVATSPEGQRYELLAGGDRARARVHGRVRHRPGSGAPRCTRSTSSRATRGCCSTTRKA